MSRSRSSSAVFKSRIKCEASITVAIVSIAATSLSENPDSSRKLNVAATGIGSPIPVD